MLMLLPAGLAFALDPLYRQMAFSNPTSLTADALHALAHPVLRSDTEIADRMTFCETLLRHTAQGDRQQNQTTVRDLAELFMLFAAPVNEPIPHTKGLIATGQPERRDFQRDPHPIVATLTETLDLSPLQGTVFLRWFSSVKDMPPPIRKIFLHRSDVRAVTILSRYVAILDEAGPVPVHAKRKRLEQTLAHEWVHVTLNSVLGPNAGNLPRWFHEGCAIAFSGSGGSHVTTSLADTPTGTQFVAYQWTPPEDYAAYGLVFRYLQAVLDDKAFHRRIGEAIQTSSVEGLLEAVSVVDFSELHQDARRWQRRGENLRWALATAVLACLAFGVWRKLSKRRLPPQDVV